VHAVFVPNYSQADRDMEARGGSLVDDELDMGLDRHL
jgi:hypothetical protein